MDENSLVAACPEESPSTFIALSYWILYSFSDGWHFDFTSPQSKTLCCLSFSFFSFSLLPTYQSNRVCSLTKLGIFMCPFLSTGEVQYVWKQVFRHLSVFLTTTGIFKSTCHIDVRWFPFDVQRCDLKFGSWTYGGWSLDLKVMDADISNYIANGEWDLVGK